MAKSKSDEKYVFRSKDFYRLLEEQKYQCKYSRRKLTPENCQAVHVVPLTKGGKHHITNIVLIDREVHYIKRYLKLDELISVCQDVIKTTGADFGIGISKRKTKVKRIQK